MSNKVQSNYRQKHLFNKDKKKKLLPINFVNENKILYKIEKYKNNHISISVNNNDGCKMKIQGKNEVERKNLKEQTTIVKEDFLSLLKSENMNLNKRLNDIQEQILQYNKTTNEIKTDYLKFKNDKNDIKLKQDDIIKIINNRFNYAETSIINLKKIIEDKNEALEDYKINNKSVIENIQNLLDKIFSDIKFLKIQIVDNKNNYQKFENLLYSKEKDKTEIAALNKENDSLKVELENIKEKYDKLDNYNNEIKNINKELKIQNNNLKRQNEELKINSEKLIKQRDEYQRRQEKIDKKEIELKNKNEKLLKQNEKLIQRQQEKKGKFEKFKEKNEKIETKKIIKKHYDKNYGVVGLNNIGNNCYMNSVLQTLKNIPQFTYNIFKLNDNGDNFLIHLKKLFINLCSSEISSFSPKEFKKYLGLEKLGKIFANNNQYDSSIFYVSLLNIIDKKLNKEKIKKIDMLKYKDKTLEEKLEIYKKNDYSYKNETFLFDIFCLYSVNEIKCKQCKNVIHIFQKSNFLDFPIVTVNGKVKSLEECFENYQKINDVKDNCSKCNFFGLTHEYIIMELPPVLIINLKRVGEQEVYFNDIKIPYKLDTSKIIKQSINIPYSIYELRGFIKHDGDEKSGHNYAFSKNMFDDKWYEYNDSTCRFIEDKLNLNKIFFLCYIKSGCDDINSGYLDKIVEALKNENK